MYLYEYLNSKNQNTLIQESGLKGGCVCVCVCEKISDYQSLISDSLAEPEPLFFYVQY